MQMNQRTITGPNTAPTRAVPVRCTRKSTSRIAADRYGTMVVPTGRPSTAPSTEMAGVMMPSPYSSAAPNSPAPTSTVRRRELVFPCGRTSASNARMPPSPRLSARSTNVMYLKETTKFIAQNTSDMTPMTFSRVGASPCSGLKHSFRA